MISFRFHVVSIVAVFLALAIGIVVGSTVIDRAIVEGLRNRVDEVRDNLDERQAANDALQAQVDELEAFATDAGPLSVDGRLTGTATVVITDAGVDREPVDRAIDLLEQSGSAVRGVLTIEAAWLLEDPDGRAELAAIVGLEPDASVGDLQNRAAELLVADLSSPVEVVDDDTGALDQISDLDLVDFEVVEEVVVPRARRMSFLIVSGPTTELGSSAHTEAFAVAADVTAGGVVVAEVWTEQEDGPDRADSLASYLGSPALSGTISTVDDLDLVPGPTVAVLTLVTARAGAVGHYGVGDSAEAAAPPVPDE